MLDLKNNFRKIKKSYFQIAGILILLLLAAFLLWFGNSRSMQSMPSLVGDVRFEGMYRIGDGEWHDIVKDEHIPSTKGDINGNQNVKAEYDAAVAELNVLKEAELKRLDKAYTDGKLTQSYYDERRYNVETNNLKNTVPFGLDEAPSFNEFKARYKNELDQKELGTDEVKMFYERMMERMRIDDFKFKEVAFGTYPKPTIVAEEVATEPERENIVVDGVIEKNVGALSERVDKTLPELTNSKDKEQLKV